MITLANDIEIIFTLGNDAASALTLFRDAWFSRVRAGINSSGGGENVIIIIVGDNRAIMISLDIHTHTNIAFPTTQSHSISENDNIIFVKRTYESVAAAAVGAGAPLDS